MSSAYRRARSSSERLISSRVVRVIGAQVIAVSTAAAASRVMTQTGWRPAGGPRSAQKISLRATTPVPCEPRAGPRIARERVQLAVADRRRRGYGRPRGCLRHRSRLAHRAEGVPNGSYRGSWQVCRGGRRGRRRVERALHVAATQWGMATSRCQKVCCNAMRGSDDLLNVSNFTPNMLSTTDRLNPTSPHSGVPQ